ncbi:MAG: sigma-70 family RNA polymerase sigma factor [Planctomycetaceae bacterium]|nr:sigma-70 family RNA polymerase sigma factor [Planctomycetaceae bacterium]
MARKTLTHAEVDRKLDGFAAEPERFEALTRAWITSLERRGTDLEISDPSSWRRPAATAAPQRASNLDQLRHDVDRIVILDREAEAQLARRVEFARWRLEAVRGPAAADGEADALEGVGWLASTWTKGTRGPDLPSEKVMRRAAELHSLRTEMVERNLYLVLINVERYAHTATNRHDLVQEGSAALFRAVDGFDWRRGLLFRTYAVHWLNQAFRNYLYNFSNTVRVPVYLQKALRQIHQAQIKLGNPAATHEELAATADLTPNLVESALGAARSSYSLDAELGGDGGNGNRLRDLLVAEDDGPYDTGLEDVSLEQGLGKAMERLSDREQLVVGMRFGIGRDRESTLAEVAAELGVSVERVRQIQVRALAKLNTPALRRELDPFLN